MDGKQKRPQSPGSRNTRPAASGSGRAPQRVKRKPTAQEAQNQQTKPKQPKASADVVYLAPKPFSRNRLLLRLVSVAAVVIALVLGISVFFKVDKVTVSGNDKYGAWDIREASGIEIGDNLLTFSRAKASGKIIKTLPYVKSVRIGIKLPDTVMIDVVEFEVTYQVEARDGSWWLVSSDGKAVEKLETGVSDGYTKLIGVRIEVPEAGSAVKAMEMPAQTDEAGAEIPITVTAAQRLSTALDIAQYLERNGIIGEAASIDVSAPGDLRVWYGERFRVMLGDSTQLSFKIASLKNIIDNMADYAGGELDLSDPNDIQYDPF